MMKNFALSPELVNAAYEVAEEIHKGKHVHDPRTQSTWSPEIIQELERRCPGYTEAAYRRAMDEGWFAAR
jgi:hypothetical protein